MLGGAIRPTKDGEGDMRMTRTRALLSVVVFALLQNGCVRWAWAPPGTDRQQFARDKYECEREMHAVGAGVGTWANCMEARGYATTLLPIAPSAHEASPPRPVEISRNPDPGSCTWTADGCISSAGDAFKILTEKRRPVTQELLRRIEDGQCPRLVLCMREYEDRVRRIGADVDYPFSSRDELLFRAVREIAKASDEGTITQDQAVNRLLALDVQIDEIYRALQIERARRQR